MIPSLMQQRIYKRKLLSASKKTEFTTPESFNQKKRDESLHHDKNKSLIHIIYILFHEKSILEWIALLSAGLFVVSLILTFYVEKVTHDSYRFDIVFPSDSDLDSYYYETFVPLAMQEDNEFVPPSEVVQTLSIKTYEVKKGDTISGIAKSLRLNIDTIISYNNIKSIRKIYSGMKLLVPNTDGVKYIVRKGDCLSSIAIKFGIALNNLLDWNNVSSSIINSGDILFIPGAKMNRFDLAQVMGTLFLYPVKGRLSSRYGWRIHPISKKRSFHNGIDIMGPLGSTIKASMDGKILKTGFNNIYGKYVIIRHDNGFQTFYGHLSKITSEKGDAVLQGNKIGEMGTTGYSTGSHVHFCIYKNGETVDPLLYLK
ncbi:MAG: M23 family metallopeptidase [Spirochaetales bacterium]|nr:M23 family metallopeptidase [Spirochaetales bacterium]